MTTPTLYYNNALLRSLEGLGDGTVHNRAVSATPDPANKRFTLGAQTRIADLAGVSDDYFNGYTLWFPETKGRYLVTDWEEGAGRATTLETPNLIDTGPCEFRRVLYTPSADPAYPAPRACDGHPSIIHRVSAANKAFDLRVHLPNLIGQGGFEEFSVGPVGTAPQDPGKPWATTTQWDVQAAAGALLGSRMATYSGGTTDSIVKWRLVEPLRAGKRYRLIFKAQAVSGTTASSPLVIYLSGYRSGVAMAGFPGTSWGAPALTETPTWYASADFVAPITTDDGLLEIVAVFANKGAASAIRLDEVYLWEVVPVSALLAFGHNWDGVAAGSGLEIEGWRADAVRSGWTAADRAILSAASAVTGTGPVKRTWTVADPPTVDQAFPIYRISIPANASFQYEVGELLLAQAWPWGKHPERGWETQKRRYRKDRAEALGGARRTALYHEQRRFDARVVSVPVVDEAIWEGTFREYHIKREEPFAVEIPGKFDSQPILMRCDEAKLNHSGVRPDADFEFGEVL